MGRSKVIGEIQLKPKVRAAQVIGNSIYSFPVYTFTTDDKEVHCFILIILFLRLNVPAS